jgi:WD repeat-containing protein 1 (actin-interacting protein 1)
MSYPPFTFSHTNMQYMCIHYVYSVYLIKNHMKGGEDAKTCFYAGPPFKIDHSNSDHNKEVWCARFSPDGNKLASVGADRRIVFYDSKEGNKTSEIVEGSPDAHTGSIISCCWSPDSTKLMTCSLDKTVKVWDTNAMTCETTFTFGNSVCDMQCGVVWCGNFIVSLNLAGEVIFVHNIFLYFSPSQSS